MAGVVVLYEDHRAAGPSGRSFALHILLMALVGDRRGVDAGVLPHGAGVRSIPKGGVDNVLSALFHDYDLLTPGGVAVGIVDADRLAEHVRRGWVRDLPAGADAATACAAFIASHPAPARVRLLPLDANLESVIRGIGDCDKALPAAVLKAALDKRTGMQDRERVLQRAAAGARAVRDCLGGRVPSVNIVADTLHGLIPA